MARGIKIPGVASSIEDFQPTTGYSPSQYKGTTAASGTDALQDTQADIDIEGLIEKLWEVEPPTSGAATPDNTPYIAVNPQSKRVYVNGFEFAENDDASALQSREYLQRPGTPADPAQGWRRVSQKYYDAYLSSIEDPNLGQLAGKRVARGFASLREMLGYSLMLASGGVAGAGIVTQAEYDQQRLAPYDRRFTQIKSADDAVEWFVGSVAEAVPFIAESIISGIAGGIAGGAVGSATAPGVGTAAGGVGGAAAGLAAKKVVKTTLKQVIAKKYRGEILSAQEHMLLSRATGAALGSSISNYAVGVGDIRSEQNDMGVIDQEGSEASALLRGVPYALLSSVPEFAAGWALFSQAAVKGGMASRFGKGVAIGATLEGTTELGQEALVVGSAEELGAQYAAADKTERWIEAFAAGAAVGGGLGGPINLMRPRSDDKKKQATPTAPTPAPTTPSTPAAPQGPETIDMSGLADLPDDFGIPTATNQPAQPAGERPAYDPGTRGYMGGIDEDTSPGAPQIFPEGPAPIVQPAPGTDPQNISVTGGTIEPVPQGQVPARRAAVPVRASQENPIVALPAEEPPAAPTPKPGNLFPDDDMGPPGKRTNLTGRPYDPVPGQPSNTDQEALDALFARLAPAAGVDTEVAGPPAVEPGQKTLLTKKGEPTKAVQAATAGGLENKNGLAPKQFKALGKAMADFPDLFPVEAGREIADNTKNKGQIVVEPNELNISTMRKKGNVLILDVDVGKGGKRKSMRIAYNEDKFGSPEAFAEAIGLPYGAIDTATYTRVPKTSGEPVQGERALDYTPPPKAPANTEERAKKRAARKEKPDETPPPAPTTPTKRSLKAAVKKQKETETDVPERSAAPVVVEEQTGSGERDGSQDAAGRKASRTLKRKPEQAAEPAGEKAQEVPTGAAAVEDLKKRVLSRAERTKKTGKVEAAKNAAKAIELTEKKSLKKEGRTTAEKQAELETKLSELAMNMKFDLLEDTVINGDLNTTEEYAYTKAYIIRLAKQDMPAAQEFVEDTDLGSKNFKRAVDDAKAELKKEGVDLAGKKPGNKPRFSTTDDDTPKLPDNVVSFEQEAKQRGKPNGKNSIDQEAELVDIINERIKRGIKPFKPNLEMWERLTDAEREQVIAELDASIAEDAEYQRRRDEVLSKKLMSLFEKKVFEFAPGDLIHITDVEMQGLPWKVLDFYIDANDTRRFGYTIWHPLWGNRYMVIEDGDKYNAAKTQAQWSRATAAEKADYLEAEAAGLEAITELAHKAGPDRKNRQEKMAEVRAAMEAKGFKLGDRIITTGLNGPHEIMDVAFSKARNKPAVILKDIEGISKVWTINNLDAELAAWTKMGIQGSVDPTGRFSLSAFNEVTNPEKLGRIKMRIAQLARTAKKVGVKVYTFKNQIDLRNNRPDIYDRASRARLFDLNSRVRGTDEAPADFLPELERDSAGYILDPDIAAVVDKLYEHRDIILVNPTPEQLRDLYFRGKGYAIKLMATRHGNLVAFSSKDIREHIDAAAMLGWAGEYGRGYWYVRDYQNMTREQYVTDPGRFLDSKEKQWVVDKTARGPARRGSSISAEQTKDAIEQARAAQDKEAERAERINLREVNRRRRFAVPNDFDRLDAAGFSFGDNEIIIFTDNIANDAHLDFVFNHEVSGHVGLAGVIGTENMATVMDIVYDYSPTVRAKVEERRALHLEKTPNAPFSKAEAVEEVLADTQAEMVQLLESETLIQKVVRAIKEFLADIGFEVFNEQQVYLLLRNARAYTRTGKRRAHAFVNSEMAAKLTRRSRNAPRFAQSELSQQQARLEQAMKELGASATWQDIADKLSETGRAVQPKSLRRTASGYAAAYREMGEPVPEYLEVSRPLNADTAKKSQTGPGKPSTRRQRLIDTLMKNQTASRAEIAAILGETEAYVKATMNQIRATYTAEELALPSMQWLQSRSYAPTTESNKRLGRPPGNAGRFSLVNPIEFSDVAGRMNVRSFDRRGIGLPATMQDAFEHLAGLGTNIREVVSRVLSEIKTMNFSARSNLGYQEGYQILNDTMNLISQLRTKYNSMLEDLLHEADRATILKVSEMLQFTATTKLPKATDKMLKELGALIEIVDGEVVVKAEEFARLKKMGRYTLEEFQQGIDVEYEDFVVGPDDKIVKKKFRHKIEAIPDLTADSKLWQLYQKTRDAMDEAAIDRVKADYYAASGERKNVVRRLASVINRTLTVADEKFIFELDKRYRQIAQENATENDDGSYTYDKGAIEKAEQLMAKFNAYLIGRTDDSGRLTELVNMFPEDQRASIEAAAKAFREGVVVAESMKYEAQRIISNMAALELGKEDSELYAKRSIVGGYVPIGRQGAWQVRAVARDENGTPVRIKDEFRRQLPYFQVADRAAAERLARDVNEVSGNDLQIRVPVYDPDTKTEVVKTVKVTFLAEAARQTPTGDTRINLNEFVRLISRFGVNLTPAARERIVVGMTEQNARARSNLLRENVPGQDPNSIPYISQHLEALANISGRRQNQHRIDILLDDNDRASQAIWNMDEGRLAALEARVKALEANPSANPAQIAAARRERDAYHFAFVRTNGNIQLIANMEKALEKLRNDPDTAPQALREAEAALEEYKKNNKPRAGTGGGNKWKDKFVRDMAYLDDQKSLEYSDFASDGVAADVKTFTSVAQLGGSFATGALNIASLALNVLPALSFYNSKNAFGGGFGMARSSAELIKAMGQVGGLGKYKAGYYEAMLDDPARLAKEGLTRSEAEFLRNEIAFGNLQAAASNALTASARGKFAGNANAQKFIDIYMSAFTYTEQASRRGAALAAYRMAYERARVEGKTPVDADIEASAFAADIVKQTVGQYSMFNRPGFFRGGVQQFIFMYKMYPITTVQLLSALPPQGQLAMLTVLWMTAGMKGMPFGEDMLDLLDTIAQMLGLKIGSVEGAITRQIDEILPGASAYAMRGIVDQVAPFTLSTRMSLGNLIPGTSVGVAGSDPYREITEVLGPAYSAMEGMTKLGVNLTKGTAALVGLSDREVELSTLLRDNPVTLARAIGDVMTYMDTGAIVDSKGYVVSEDVSAGVLASRVLGFYPSEATRQNDIIRMSKRAADYQRAVSTEFRLKYVRAALAGDDAKVRQVIEDVRQWNAASVGTGLEIRNFTMNANRALREAKKSATARFEKSAPKTVRPLVQEYREAYGMEDE